MSIITQSKKLVQCPQCSKIQKAYGDQYFICCRTRWDLETHRYQKENNYNGKCKSGETNRKQTGNPSKSDNNNRSDLESGQSESGNGGKLEFV